METQVIITIVGVVSSGITGIFGWFVGRKRKNAEADGV